MDKNYLLTTSMAYRLYHETAYQLPLIDYHNHLSVDDLIQDRQFEDIAQLWLLGDPYKHRVMRICGVNESLITGTAGHKEKFRTWCKTYPKLLGGPMYDWSRMELETIFDIHTEINGANADKLWDEANSKLSSKDYSARSIFRRFHVEYAAPCTAITDDLSVFSEADALAPSLRGDNLLCPERTTIDQLEFLTGIPILDFSSFRAAVSLRLDAMEKVGCCFSDHALDHGFQYKESDGNCDQRFACILTGTPLSIQEKTLLASDILRMLGEEYAKRCWTMQLHIGALRFTNTRLLRASGPAGGFAAVSNNTDISSLCRLLDDLDQSSYGIPHTILYTLNPADNAAISVLSGSFPGVTQGPAWWWCDHLQGMREMLDIFSHFSVLYTFTGMTTDSRSLLSLLRHDYFRRTLCGWIGEKAQRGELPDSFETLSELVKALCYGNAKKLIKKRS